MKYPSLLTRLGKQRLIDLYFRIRVFFLASPVAIIRIASYSEDFRDAIYGSSLKPFTEDTSIAEMKKFGDVAITVRPDTNLKSYANELVSHGYKCVVTSDHSHDPGEDSENIRYQCTRDLTSPFCCDDILSWADRPLQGRPFLYCNTPAPGKRFNLVIGLMIRNGADRLEEWIEHYLSEGVDHFYIVNHLSTDSYRDILSPYKEHITLWRTDRAIKFTGGNIEHPYLYGQKIALQRYVNSGLYHYARHYTRWISILDHDELLWSKSGNLHQTIEEQASGAHFVLVPWRTLYGDALQRETSVVYSCTRRYKEDRFVGGKGIVNTAVPVQGLWHLHLPNFADPGDVRKIDKESKDIGLNHYQFPSAEVLKLKQSIGGDYGEWYRDIGADLDDVQMQNQQEFSDTTLKDLHKARGIEPRKPLQPRPIVQAQAPLGNAVFRREYLD